MLLVYSNYLKVPQKCCSQPLGMVDLRIKKTLLTSFSPFFTRKSTLNMTRVGLQGASPSPSLENCVLGCLGQSQTATSNCLEGVVHISCRQELTSCLVLKAETINIHLPSNSGVCKLLNCLLCMATDLQTGQGRLQLSKFTVQQRRCTCP